MSNFTGMDIAAVRTLSRQLQARADEIRQISHQLAGQLKSAPWVGPDREQFLADWTGEHTPVLNSVVRGLEAAAARALKNSNEQEHASGR